MNKAESWLEKMLQYRFQNAELFQQALTHRSATGQNNERLEFLGDAVLDFVISEAVYRLNPTKPEGDLTRLRASLVKEETLAELALDMQLGEQLIFGSGEQKTGAHRRESILADALEAIFGAVFLDQGFIAAKAVIERIYAQRLRDLPDVAERDPKTRLQEWLQARKMGLPDYEVVAVSGKQHLQRIAVTCTVQEKSATTNGESTTRRKAEQKAARKMFALVTEGKQ